MAITLYSTGCPNCKALELKLNRKNVDFELSNDIQTMVNKGYKTAPLLEVDGEIMTFGDAIKWVNALE